MVCSLLSSQTRKSLAVKSRTYSPFLSVTTASTSTTLVSLLMTGGAVCGQATAADARQNQTPRGRLIEYRNPPFAWLSAPWNPPRSLRVDRRREPASTPESFRPAESSHCREAAEDPA